MHPNSSPRRDQIAHPRPGCTVCQSGTAPTGRAGWIASNAVPLASLTSRAWTRTTAIGDPETRLQLNIRLEVQAGRRRSGKHGAGLVQGGQALIGGKRLGLALRGQGSRDVERRGDAELGYGVPAVSVTTSRLRERYSPLGPKPGRSITISTRPRSPARRRGQQPEDLADRVADLTVGTG